MTNYVSGHDLKIIIDNAKLTNNIRLTCTCKRGCVFCFQRQQGPIRKKESLQLEKTSKEDFKKILEVLDYDKAITIDGGDIFNYPLIHDFIEMMHNELIKRNSNSNLEINSTFADFNINKINVLKKMKNVRLSLSLVTFDTNFKNEIMAAGWSEKQTNIVKKVIQSGILSACTIWTFGNLSDLKKDLNIFRKLVSNTIQKEDFALELSYPASTRYSNKINKIMSKKALSNWYVAIKMFLDFIRSNSLKGSLYSVNDLSKYPREDIDNQNYYMDDFRKRIKEAMQCIISEKKIDISEVAFITSKSCYNYGKEIFPTLNWIKAEHIYYGGNISCCRLLTLSDIEKVIKKHKKYSVYVLNKGTFLDDLIHNSIESLKREINSKILLF